MATEKTETGTPQKALLAVFFVIMAVFGLTNIIIGAINMDQCYDAGLLPPFLVANGVMWFLPPLLLLFANCLSHDDVVTLYDFLEKAFFFFFVLMFGGTVYAVVAAVHVKTLDRLCVYPWVPPFGFAAIVASWVLFAVFFRLFCVHESRDEDKPPAPMEFRHLRNLPPLVFPWNRHRSMRLY